MNHRAESVIWHMVEGDKNRTSYFFAQPLNAEEFLLQGHTCTSEDVEATEVKRAELNLQLHASYKQYGRKKKVGEKSHQLSYNVERNPCIRSKLVLHTAES